MIPCIDFYDGENDVNYAWILRSSALVLLKEITNDCTSIKAHISIKDAISIDMSIHGST